MCPKSSFFFVPDQYYLFAHFPNNPKIAISAVDLNNALKSKNKDLKDLAADVEGVDVDGFLKVFTVHVTPKYDDLMNENGKQLAALGFNRVEVDTLFYTNAIQIIADLSIKHDAKLNCPVFSRHSLAG